MVRRHARARVSWHGGSGVSVCIGLVWAQTQLHIAGNVVTMELGQIVHC